MAITLQGIRCCQNGSVYIGWTTPGGGNTFFAGTDGSNTWVTQLKIYVDEPIKAFSMALYCSETQSYSGTPLNWGISSSESQQVNNNYNSQTGTVLGSFYFPYTYTKCSVSGSFADLAAGTYYISIWNGSSNGAFARIINTSSYTPTVSYTAGVINTATTAPTSVSTSPAYVAPGGTVTISWSGAKGGTSNSITGYDVYYQIGSGTKTTVGTISSTSSSGSTTFTLPTTATRGSSITAYVRTRGSAGSSWYSGEKSGSGAKVNQLPGKPTATAKTVASNVTSATVSVTTPTDADGHAVTLYYSTSTDATKRSFTSNSTSLTVGSTYYFYGRDSIGEYSAASSAYTFGINTAPSISSSSVAASVTKTIKNRTGFSGNSTYEVKVNATVNASKNGTATLYYRYATYTTGTPTWSSEQQYGTATVSSGTMTATNMNIYNKIGANKLYQIGLKFTDSYESTSIVWITGTTFSIAPFPIILDKFNQWDYSSISGTNTNNFYRRIRLKLSYDEGLVSNSAISSVACVRTGGSGANNASIKQTIIDSTNGYMYVDLENEDGLIANTTYTFQLTLANTSYSQSGSTSTTMVQTPVYVPSNISGGLGSTKIDAFAASTSTQISMGKEVAVSTLTAWANYYNMSNAKVSFSIKNANTLISIDSYLTALSLSGDYLTTTLTIGSGLCGLIISNFKTATNLIGELKFDLIYTVTNLFGQTKTGTAYNNFMTVSFDKAPVLAEASGGWIRYRINSTTAVLNKSSQKISEGLILYFLPSIKFYGGNSFSYEVQIARTNNTPIESDWLIYKKGTGTYTNNTAYNTPSTWSDTNQKIEVTVPEITTSTNCYFRFKLIPQNGKAIYLTTSSSSIYGPYMRKRHTAPAFILNGIAYSEETSGAKMIIRFNSDLGISSSDVISGSSAILKYAQDVATASTPKTATLTTNFALLDLNGEDNIITLTGLTKFSTNEDFERGLVVITTKSTTTYGSLSLSTTKTSTSNITIIYNTIPTIAHRQNHLGINYKNFDSDEVFVIRDNSGRHMVSFKSATGKKVTIDLLEGEIDGAVINGGSWNA